MKKQIQSQLLCLQKSFLFSGMSKQFLQNILSDCSIDRRQYRKGEEIYCSDFLLIVLKGKIFAYQGAESTILRVFQKGDCLGAAFLYAKDSFGLLRVVAASNCEVLLLPVNTVTRLRKEYWQINENYISFLCGRIAFLNQKISGFTGGSTKNKLLLYVYDLKKEKKELVTNNISCLARSLDMSRSSLYRAICALEKQGILFHKGKEIYIRKEDY